MKREFVRSETHRYSRLGRGRPKLRRWRRPRGKHNKTRLKRFSYPVQPEIGFGTPKKSSGRVQGLVPTIIHNIADLQKLNKVSIAIIARTIGAKKKIEILKKASELNIKVANFWGRK